MVSKKVIIKNVSGLHLRPASYFVNTTGMLKSKVYISVDGKLNVNGKSIVNIMTACIKQGTEIEIICEGETEESDLCIILEAISNGLGE